MAYYNLFILDITNADYTNGVDRYISCLKEGLSTVHSIRLHHIQLIAGGRKTLPKREEEENYTKITIPLPEQAGNVISKLYWTNKYNEVVYELIAPEFQGKEHILLHIHTLNLIDLSVEIKKHYPVQIITHLHCIPWKASFNDDPVLFNQIYVRYYLERKYQDYEARGSERRSYLLSDKVIACTRCGKQFVTNITGVPDEKIEVISNGMADLNPQEERSSFSSDGTVKILFVGSVVPAKGIFYILDALRAVVRSGYDVELYVAGSGPDIHFARIREEYGDIPVRLLSSLSFDRLQEYYRNCDIGIIGSVQEQNSYVAIEMAMFGLPVIVTAVDGLDEMFTDRTDALKVNVSFDRVKGLRVDTEQMSDRIIELITHPEIRMFLSHNIRRLYRKEYTLDRLVERVVRVYRSLIHAKLQKTSIP